MSKRLGGTIGYKYETSSWHLNGFPYHMVVTLGQQYSIGEKPTVILCTLTLIAMQGQQKNSEDKIVQYVIKHGSNSIYTVT